MLSTRGLLRKSEKDCWKLLASLKQSRRRLNDRTRFKRSSVLPSSSSVTEVSTEPTQTQARKTLGWGVKPATTPKSKRRRAVPKAAPSQSGTSDKRTRPYHTPLSDAKREWLQWILSILEKDSIRRHPQYMANTDDSHSTAVHTAASGKSRHRVADTGSGKPVDSVQMSRIIAHKRSTFLMTELLKDYDSLVCNLATEMIHAYSAANSGASRYRRRQAGASDTHTDTHSDSRTVAGLMNSDFASHYSEFVTHRMTAIAKYLSQLLWEHPSTAAHSTAVSQSLPSTVDAVSQSDTTVVDSIDGNTATASKGKTRLKRGMGFGSIHKVTSDESGAGSRKGRTKTTSAMHLDSVSEAADIEKRRRIFQKIQKQIGSLLQLPPYLRTAKGRVQFFVEFEFDRVVFVNPHFYPKFPFNLQREVEHLLQSALVQSSRKRVDTRLRTVEREIVCYPFGSQFGRGKKTGSERHTEELAQRVLDKRKDDELANANASMSVASLNANMSSLLDESRFANGLYLSEISRVYEHSFDSVFPLRLQSSTVANTAIGSKALPQAMAEEIDSLEDMFGADYYKALSLPWCFQPSTTWRSKQTLREILKQCQESSVLMCGHTNYGRIMILPLPSTSPPPIPAPTHSRLELDASSNGTEAATASVLLADGSTESAVADRSSDSVGLGISRADRFRFVHTMKSAMNDDSKLYSMRELRLEFKARGLEDLFLRMLAATGGRGKRPPSGTRELITDGKSGDSRGERWAHESKLAQLIVSQLNPFFHVTRLPHLAKSKASVLLFQTRYPHFMQTMNDAFSRQLAHCVLYGSLNASGTGVNQLRDALKSNLSQSALTVKLKKGLSLDRTASLWKECGNSLPFAFTHTSSSYSLFHHLTEFETHFVRAIPTPHHKTCLTMACVSEKGDGRLVGGGEENDSVDALDMFESVYEKPAISRDASKAKVASQTALLSSNASTATSGTTDALLTSFEFVPTQNYVDSLSHNCIRQKLSDAVQTQDEYIYNRLSRDCEQSGFGLRSKLEELSGRLGPNGSALVEFPFVFDHFGRLQSDASHLRAVVARFDIDVLKYQPTDLSNAKLQFGDYNSDGGVGFGFGFGFGTLQTSLSNALVCSGLMITHKSRPITQQLLFHPNAKKYWALLQCLDLHLSARAFTKAKQGGGAYQPLAALRQNMDDLLRTQQLPMIHLNPNTEDYEGNKKMYSGRLMRKMSDVKFEGNQLAIANIELLNRVFDGWAPHITLIRKVDLALSFDKPKTRHSKPESSKELTESEAESRKLCLYRRMNTAIPELHALDFWLANKSQIASALAVHSHATGEVVPATVSAGKNQALNRNEATRSLCLEACRRVALSRFGVRFEEMNSRSQSLLSSYVHLVLPRMVFTLYQYITANDRAKMPAVTEKDTAAGCKDVFETTALVRSKKATRVVTWITLLNSYENYFGRMVQFPMRLLLKQERFRAKQKSSPTTSSRKTGAATAAVIDDSDLDSELYSLLNPVLGSVLQTIGCEPRRGRDNLEFVVRLKPDRRLKSEVQTTLVFMEVLKKLHAAKWRFETVRELKHDSHVHPYHLEFLANAQIGLSAAVLSDVSSGESKASLSTLSQRSALQIGSNALVESTAKVTETQSTDVFVQRDLDADVLAEMGIAERDSDAVKQRQVSSKSVEKHFGDALQNTVTLEGKSKTAVRMTTLDMEERFQKLLSNPVFSIWAIRKLFTQLTHAECDAIPDYVVRHICDCFLLRGERDSLHKLLMVWFASKFSRRTAVYSSLCSAHVKAKDVDSALAVFKHLMRTLERRAEAMEIAKPSSDEWQAKDPILALLLRENLEPLLHLLLETGRFGEFEHLIERILQHCGSEDGEDYTALVMRYVLSAEGFKQMWQSCVKHSSVARMQTMLRFAQRSKQSPLLSSALSREDFMAAVQFAATENSTQLIEALWRFGSNPQCAFAQMESDSVEQTHCRCLSEMAEYCLDSATTSVSPFHLLSALCQTDGYAFSRLKHAPKLSVETLKRVVESVSENASKLSDGNGVKVMECVSQWTLTLLKSEECVDSAAITQTLDAITTLLIVNGAMPSLLANNRGNADKLYALCCNLLNASECVGNDSVFTVAQFAAKIKDGKRVGQLLQRMPVSEALCDAIVLHFIFAEHCPMTASLAAATPLTAASVESKSEVRLAPECVMVCLSEVCQFVESVRLLHKSFAAAIDERRLESLLCAFLTQHPHAADAFHSRFSMGSAIRKPPLFAPLIAANTLNGSTENDTLWDDALDDLAFK